MDDHRVPLDQGVSLQNAVLLFLVDLLYMSVIQKF